MLRGTRILVLAVGLGLGSVAQAAAPVQPLSPGSIAQVTLGLLVVLGLFVGVAFLLRRFSGVHVPGRDATLRVVASVNLSTRDRVVLMQVHDHQVLLGLSPSRIQPLHVFRPDALPDADDFPKQLQQQLTTGAK